MVYQPKLSCQLKYSQTLIHLFQNFINIFEKSSWSFFPLKCKSLVQAVLSLQRKSYSWVRHATAFICINHSLSALPFIQLIPVTSGVEKVDVPLNCLLHLWSSSSQHMVFTWNLVDMLWKKNSLGCPNWRPFNNARNLYSVYDIRMAHQRKLHRGLNFLHLVLWVAVFCPISATPSRRSICFPGWCFNVSLERQLPTSFFSPCF